MNDASNNRAFPSRDAFATWLAQQPDDIVGFPSNECDCPLARFCNDNGLSGIIISNASIFKIEDTFSVPLPDWAQRFVLKIGGTFSIPLPNWAQRFVHDIDASPHERITGSLALAILNNTPSL